MSAETQPFALVAIAPPGRRRALWLDWLGAGVLALVVLVSLFGPLLAPYPANEQTLERALAPPFSSGHLLGTDNLGRDTLSRLFEGARISLAISIAAAAIGLAGGLAVGLVAGSRRGWLDSLLMRAMDVLLAFPALVLALVVAAALGPGTGTTIAALAVVCVPYFARSSRNLTTREYQREFVAAARLAGASQARILGSHVLPNIFAPIGVQATFAIAYLIPAEAALSFVGVGVQPPAASWGNMMSDGYQTLSIDAWPVLLPAIAVIVAVAAVSLSGDALSRRAQAQ